jgi:tRNA1Val (adenine37-N6)-methyltransferase
METEGALRPGETAETLSGGVKVIVGNGCTFNSDTVLLAWYSLPKKGEACADLGTGCGTIPLLWCARAHPRAVWGAELQPEACSMARRSVLLSGLAETIHILECDVRALPETAPTPGSLDVVACNPPYSPAGAGALSEWKAPCAARHETAGTLADFAACAASLLRWGGRFFCCMRPERLGETLFTLHEAGLEPKRIRFVQQRAASAPFLFLLQANRGGRPGMKAEPVLLTEDAAGGLSKEMRGVYGDYKEGHL